MRQQTSFSIFINPSELVFRSVKSSGPGGQHVNTSSTKAVLTWNLEQSNSLNLHQKDMAAIQLASFLNSKGEIKISSDRFRSLARNKQDCLEKLELILSKALRPVKKRQKTKTPKSQKKKRLDNKKRRSDLKQSRKPPSRWE